MVEQLFVGDRSSPTKEVLCEVSEDAENRSKTQSVLMLISLRSVKRVYEDASFRVPSEVEAASKAACILIWKKNLRLQSMGGT